MIPPAKRGSGLAPNRVFPLSRSVTDLVAMVTASGLYPRLPTVSVAVAMVPGAAVMGLGGDVTNRSLGGAPALAVPAVVTTAEAKKAKAATTTKTHFGLRRAP